MASCKPARSAFPPTDSHWLSPYRRAFLESLSAQGYAVRTIKSFRLMLVFDSLSGITGVRIQQNQHLSR